jgi:hypothetical protein
MHALHSLVLVLATAGSNLRNPATTDMFSGLTGARSNGTSPPCTQPFWDNLACMLLRCSARLCGTAMRQTVHTRTSSVRPGHLRSVLHTPAAKQIARLTCLQWLNSAKQGTAVVPPLAAAAAAVAAAADCASLLCVGGLRHPIDCITAAKDNARSLQHMLTAAGPSADAQLGKALLLLCAGGSTATAPLTNRTTALSTWLA